jgi:hypothetical protein
MKENSMNLYEPADALTEYLFKKLVLKTAIMCQQVDDLAHIPESKDVGNFHWKKPTENWKQEPCIKLDSIIDIYADSEQPSQIYISWNNFSVKANDGLDKFVNVEHECFNKLQHA